MKSFSFKKIDAFATSTSGGNPAGTVWLENDGDITQAEMQQIARELKFFVSEVGYVFPAGPDSIRLKFYSSEREVNFCGHATVAILHELCSTDPSFRDRRTVTVITNDGPLAVENNLEDDGSVFITAPFAREISPVPGMAEVAESLKIDTDCIDPQLPLKIINAGLNTLLVPLLDPELVLRTDPELLPLKTFCTNNNIDIVEIFSRITTDAANDIRARVFAPTFGYLEDPATGSGNSALGYYLDGLGLWEGAGLCIEQNGRREGYNLVRLKRITVGAGGTRVLFGGGGVKRIDGRYYLPDAVIA